MPVEPPPTPWQFPSPDDADDDGPRRRRRRPRAGHDPGRLPGRAVPHARRPRRPRRLVVTRPRGVLPLDGLRVSRSLRRSVRRYEVRVDTAFAEVMRRVRLDRRRRRLDHAERSSPPTPGCTSSAGPTASRRGPTTASWSAASTACAIGGFFAGESMFHRQRDASKVALVGSRRAACERRADRCSTSSG